MYNRYIPAANGRYERQSVPELPQIEPAVVPLSAPAAAQPSRPEAPAQEAGGLLAGLLPKHLDSSDLLLILILLLLLKDGSDDCGPMLLALGALLLL